MARFSGQRLLELRTAANIKRERLAVDVDRSFSSIVKWERGENTPTVADVGRIAEALGVGVEELFDDLPAAVA